MDANFNLTIQTRRKAFGLWSAALLGIGAMVGAGIFVVIGQAAALAGPWAWLSFVFGGLISLTAGYSLARLALTFLSRGGMVEYLVQLYGEGVLAGAGGVLFYLAQVIAIAAVAKAFGIYGAQLFGTADPLWQNVLALGILILFTLLATFSILVIQVLVHLAHAFQTERTGTRPLWIWLAAGGMIGILGLMLVHSQTQHPGLALMLIGLMGLALLVEMMLYHQSGRRLTRQCRVHER